MRRFAMLAAVFTLFAIACSSSGPAPTDRANPADEALPQVQVVRVDRRDLVYAITLPGSVEAYEQTTLYAKAAGYLKNIYVDKGDRVGKGQVLAELEIPEMTRQEEEVRARLTEARANAELKRLTFERLAQIREKEPDVISQQEVDMARAEMEMAQAAVAVAEANRAQLEALMEYSLLRAPFSGIVTERFVDPGALIQTAAATRQATPVVTVMNMSMVRVYVHVPEKAVPYVRQGSPAIMEVDALPGRRFERGVTRFASALDPATRTMKTEIDIPNREGTLLHGMYGKVTLTLERREGALTLPAGSLLSEALKPYVLLVEKGVIEKRPVTIGMDDGEVVEILAGLQGDEQIVVGDRSGLREGMRVRVLVPSEGSENKQ